MKKLLSTGLLVGLAAGAFAQSQINLDNLANANTSSLAEAWARMATATSDPVHAQTLLQGELAQVAAQQALTLAFADVFYLIAAVFAVALAIVPFCKTVILSDNASVEAH